MKFATFTTSNNKLPRYGFKKGNYIVDVLHLSKFFEEKNKNERCINLPSSLKSCLKNWKENFEKFKELNKALTNENIDSTTKEGFRIAQLESELNLAKIQSIAINASFKGVDDM